MCLPVPDSVSWFLLSNMKIGFFMKFFGGLVDENLIFKYYIEHVSKSENLRKVWDKELLKVNSF